jgi:chemotaxis protein MotA
MKKYIFMIVTLAIGVIGIKIAVTVIPNEYAVRLFNYSENWNDYYGITLHNIIWMIGFTVYGFMIYRLSEVRIKNKEFKYKLLPEDENTILDQYDMSQIIMNIKSHDIQNGGLGYHISKIVSQFQTNFSIEQTHEVLTSQIKLREEQIYNDYSMIRYSIWLIQSLGFIGTVMGISDTLAYIGSVNGQSEYFLSELASRLSFAFDTTFTGILIAIIIIFFEYITIKLEEQQLIKIHEYCLNNFINRLYSNSNIKVRKDEK